MEACVVCGEPVDDANSAVCNGCGRRYHLVLRQGDEGKDCGTVWVDDAYLSLQFACFNCLGSSGDPSGRPSAETPRPAPSRSGPPGHAHRSRGRRRYRKW